jgi:hypothetical protein
LELGRFGKRFYWWCWQANASQMPKSNAKPSNAKNGLKDTKKLTDDEVGAEWRRLTKWKGRLAEEAKTFSTKVGSITEVDDYGQEVTVASRPYEGRKVVEARIKRNKGLTKAITARLKLLEKEAKARKISSLSMRIKGARNTRITGNDFIETVDEDLSKFNPYHDELGRNGFAIRSFVDKIVAMYPSSISKETPTVSSVHLETAMGNQKKKKKKRTKTILIEEIEKKNAKLKNPKGGLTQAGRDKFNRETGSKLKAGVKGKADTPEKMRRKGSFLTRFFTNPSGPMVNDKGEPTRLALSANAWGEPVPKNRSDAARLAEKGRNLLDRYENTKKVEKFNPYHDELGRFTSGGAGTRRISAMPKNKSRENAKRSKEQEKEYELLRDEQKPIYDEAVRIGAEHDDAMERAEEMSVTPYVPRKRRKPDPYRSYEPRRYPKHGRNAELFD